MKLTMIIAAAGAVAAPAAAAAQEVTAPPPRPSAGVELFHSSDSDGTEVTRLAADFDLRNQGNEIYIGVRAERAWYGPASGESETRDRIFLRAADRIGDWRVQARIGTDGDTLIGSVSVHDTAPVRKELFVERDIVETRQGLDLGIYSTFAGAAVDLPVNERNLFTALAGAQFFTGDNVRLHLRGSYVHVVQPDWGLSVQLRGRYFSSSDPGEFDYYSPRWYAEILPVVQLRRFVGGWEMVGAGGVGAQRDSESDWRQSRFAHVRFRSPARSDWNVHGAFTYTNNPSVSSVVQSGYSYVQFTLGIARRF